MAVAVLAGCGTTTVRTVTEQAPVARSTASDRDREADRDARAERRAAAKAKSAKRAAAKTAPSGRWASCDGNIEVWQPRTSCGFAQNAFYEYWVAGQTSPVMVHSPAVGRALRTRCRSGVSRVICTTGDGGRVRFPVVALEMYSDEQAADYAAAHDTGTDSTSALAGVGSSGTDPYDEGEPSSDDYDSSPGEEIPNYDNGTGSRVQCADGMYSQSGGRPGACSGHGGVAD
ncbi:MAG: hypothetical protein WC558_15135 [Patulibacter sp.]